MQSDSGWKNTRQATAAADELHALLKESDEIETQRKQLTQKVNTLRAAFKVGPGYVTRLSSLDLFPLGLCKLTPLQ